MKKNDSASLSDVGVLWQIISDNETLKQCGVDDHRLIGINRFCGCDSGDGNKNTPATSFSPIKGIFHCKKCDKGGHFYDYVKAAGWEMPELELCNEDRFENTTQIEDGNLQLFLNRNDISDEKVQKAVEDIKNSGLTFDTCRANEVRLTHTYFTDAALESDIGFNTFDGQNILDNHVLTIFPYYKHNENGEPTVEFRRYKLNPRFKNDKGEITKYLQPKGVPTKPYIPSSVWDERKESTPIWITEGEKKTLKLWQHGCHSIGLSGVWNFRAKDGTDLDPEIKKFRWLERQVYIAFDMDMFNNAKVLMALYELSFRLYHEGAEVYIVTWPKKYKGIDDYLVTKKGKSIDSAIKKIKKEAIPILKFIKNTHDKAVLRALGNTKEGEIIEVCKKVFKCGKRELKKDIAKERKKYYKPDPIVNIHGNVPKPYHINENIELFEVKENLDLDVITEGKFFKISNFIPYIKEEIITLDGVNSELSYVIEGKKKNCNPSKDEESKEEYQTLPDIEVLTHRFEKMEWVSKWGNAAIIESKYGVKDKLRHFTQKFSEAGLKRTTYYSHTGWAKDKDGWFYITSKGAIGRENINVKLPNELKRYSLPLVIDKQTEREAIDHSTSFLKIADEEITLPLFAFIYLAPLTTLLDPMPNFSAYMVGQTGSFKSTIAICMLNHFGSFSVDRLSNFSDTANSLAKRAFTLKDILMVIDDLHPAHTKREADKMHETAQRIIRSSSNRTDRARLNSDSTEKGRYEPRGMTIITAEEYLTVQSTVARLMTIELKKESIDVDKLSEFQEKADLLPYAMTSFISWLSNNIGNIQGEFKNQFPILRRKFQEANVKFAKLPEQASYLYFSLFVVCSWLLSNGIITRELFNKFLKDYESLLKQVIIKQSNNISKEDPVKQFIDICSTLIEQEKVCIRNKEQPNSDNDIIGDTKSNLIGWYDNDCFYFIPKALWREIKEFCRAMDAHFPVGDRALHSMLKSKGWIFKSRQNEHTASIRINGDVKRVLVLKKNIFDIKEDKVTKENICNGSDSDCNE